MKAALPQPILLAICLGAALWLFQACSYKPATGGAELRAKAEKGDAEAQFNLGKAYANITNDPKAHAEAVKWYRKAAEQGLADAQMALWLMYGGGLSVPQNNAEAYKWLLLAEAQGHQLAKTSMPSFQAGLTALEKAEGQRLAREWKPRK